MGTHQPIRKTITPEIPDKLYFRIGDVAALCEVPAYVLRFWETEFSQLKPNKGGTGQRLYRKRDVEMALRIKSLLYDQGYTIPGARQVFKNETKPKEVPASAFTEAPSVTVPEAAVHTIQAFHAMPAPAPEAGELTKKQMARLRVLREEMRSLLEQLGGSATEAPESKPAAKLKPMRPRLVVEPGSSTPHRAKPAERSQGDLFPVE